MSWTLTQQPSTADGTILPVYNNLIIKGVSSLYVAGYYYELRLTINSFSATPYLITLRKSALTDGSVFFEIQKVLENYVSHDWSNTVETFSLNPNSFASVVWTLTLKNSAGANIDYIEVINNDDSPYQFVHEGTGATAYAFTVYNSVVEKRDRLTYNPTLYTGTLSTYYATSRQKEFPIGYISLDQHDTCYFHCDLDDSAGDGIAKYLRIKTYTGSTLVKNVKVANPYAISGVYATPVYDNRRFFKVPSGTQNLNLINNAILIGGTQPLITDSITSYTIEILEDLEAQGIGGYAYEIEDASCIYTNYRLHWLNRLGGFEAFNFKLVSHKSIDIERSSVKQSLNRMVGTSWTYEANSRTVNQLYTKYKYKTVISSDWVTDAQAEVLAALFTSPVIYHERGYNDFVAVNLTEGNYEIKTQLCDGLIQIVATIYDNIEEQVQRG